MAFYSAGYTNVNPNFVIQNIRKTKENQDPVFKIFKNILTRGAPTIPSKLLRDTFGMPEIHDKAIHYLKFVNNNWRHVIKGGSTSNPALYFYEVLLPDILGKGFAKTFIPECPLGNIVDVNDKDIENEFVDFYSPLYNTVIEIDGEQHQSSSFQASKDKKRDNLLKRNYINLIRIPTSKLSSENLDYIKRLLGKMKINKEYFEQYCNSLLTDYKSACYMAAIRLELFLLDLYENKIIDYELQSLKLNIVLDYKIKKDDLNIIVDDFYNWLTDLFKLQNFNFERPYVEINLYSKEEDLLDLSGINVHLCLLQTYSQINYPNIYYIKNDYFLYEDNLIPEKPDNNALSTYSYKKNYFKVQTANISYNLNKKDHGETLKNILNNVSNEYKDFRANQLDIILTCLNDRSVIGILPTGAGKSLCYQLCSLLIPNGTLTVAPLQLLMLDQYNNIKQKLGITNLTFINSTRPENFEMFSRHKSLISIISPERFFSERFIDVLKDKKTNIGFIVIDEAHCLSEWGHDFRTSYLCLSHNLKSYFPSSSFLMALTGTASHRVFDDIDCEFKTFKNKKSRVIFAENMRRDNLTLKVINISNKFKRLVEDLNETLRNENNDKVLVFTKKKNGFKPHESACINLSNELQNYIQENSLPFNGDRISYFAGGGALSVEDKENALTKFLSGDCQIMFATKAFGMGVDIPDIRKTIHYGIPSSLESLYQEVGRAGRDGKPSECLIYFTPESPRNVSEFFQLPPMPIQEMALNYKYLNELETNFYFIQSSNLDLDIEEEVIINLKNFIQIINNNNIYDVTCIQFAEQVLKKINDQHLTKLIIKKDGTYNLENIRMLIEKALYRLFLLGDIYMWGMIYGQEFDNPTFSHLKLTNLNDEDKLNRLKNHILKYETVFTFDKPNRFSNRLRFLLEWVQENYFQERIQTLKTLYEQCVNFESSTAMMDFLANYFSNDPVYTRLVSKRVNPKDWEEVMKQDPITTKARIARLLESYDKITSLNYISGLTRLRLDQFEDNDGRRRMNLALQNMKEYSNKDKDRIITSSLRCLNESQKETFIECWINNLPNDLYIMYEKTHSECCEKRIILNLAKDMIEIGDIINDKLQ